MGSILVRQVALGTLVIQAKEMSIAWKELYAIVMAVLTWGIYGNVKKYYLTAITKL